MPLEIPKLDDRKFQDIVDELKSLIPHYCPEWTDHNVSDPGVTLIELFAHVAEIILYRMNRLPEVFQLVLLNLLGEMPKLPVAAETRVAFWLVEPRKKDEVEMVPNGESGIEISTIQSETEPPIIFTTVEPLAIRYPDCDFLAKHEQGKGVENYSHLILQSTKEGSKIFSDSAVEEDKFYLGFAQGNIALSNHILRITFDITEAAGDFDRLTPPYVWEAYDGNELWTSCDVIDGTDRTDAFGSKGSRSVEICLPPNIRTISMEKISSKATSPETSDTESKRYWIRIRMTGKGGKSPKIRQLQVETVGINVLARNERIMNRKTTIVNQSSSSLAVEGENHGISTGQWGQRFQLPRHPILAPRNLENSYKDSFPEELVVLGRDEKWKEVTTFAFSGKTDCHFMIDRANGEIVFPPALRQPSGEIRYFGKAPSRNKQIALFNYRIGGGSRGNVPKGRLNTLRYSNPAIHKVLNLKNAVGGQDAETIDNVLMRLTKIPDKLAVLTSLEDIYHSSWLAIMAWHETNKGQIQPVMKKSEVVLDLHCQESSDKRILVELFVPESKLQDIQSKALDESVREYLQKRALLGMVIDVRYQPVST